jgi:hypothetical protein
MHSHQNIKKEAGILMKFHTRQTDQFCPVLDTVKHKLHTKAWDLVSSLLLCTLMTIKA